MKEIEAKIETLLNQKMQPSEIEIADLEYVKENGAWVLRVFIDKENAVTLDDCGKAASEFGKILDESGILEDSYILEVSSPGLNRTLKKEKDFKRFIGSPVKIQTIIPIANQRNFLGVLLSFENGILKIADKTNGVKEIEFSNIKKANIETAI